MLKRIAASLLAMCFILPPAGWLTGQVHAETADTSSVTARTSDEPSDLQAAPVLAPSLQALLAEGQPPEFIDILIKLRDEQSLEAYQASEDYAQAVRQGEARGEQTAVAQRKALIGDWQEQAKRTQTFLLAYLTEQAEQGQVRNLKPFFIVNAIKAEVKPSVLQALLLRKEIERIDPNGKIYGIEPLPQPKTRKKREVPAEVDGIEPGLKRLGVPQVWSELGITGRGVRVGIIDGGTYYEHPSLIKQFEGYEAPDQIYTSGYYYDAVEEGQEKARPEETYNHGTHVAGIILGQAGEMNRIGVAPGAKFIAARALDEKLGTTEDLLQAAEWMLKPGGRAENAPRIINNSWGGDANNNPWFEEIANRWRVANILPVFASGNTTGRLAEPGSIANPGNLFNVLTVGATDLSGHLAPFSKIGPSAFGDQKIKPDLSAPGVEVRSAVATGGYAAYSGTSMAAPHVSGVAALVLEANPNLTVDELEALLKETATPMTEPRFPTTPNFGHGYGWVNAYDAVRKALALKANDPSDLRIRIQGHVLKKGQDQGAAELINETPPHAYRGRSLTLRAKAADDVSITSVKAYYTTDLAKAEGLKHPPQPDELKTLSSLPLTLTEGTVQDGHYEAVLEANAFAGQTALALWIQAIDFAGNETWTPLQKLSVLSGIQPDHYTNDFENQIEGWLFTGELAGERTHSDWNWGEPTATLEPKLASGRRLIGTKVGYNGVTKVLDSYAYMPPLDLSDKTLKQVKLSFDEYLGFNGVTTAQIQIAENENGPWTILDEKLIAPGTQPAWQSVSYNLAQWIGKPDPIHVRFYFHSPDHGEGVGWYLDQVQLTSQDLQAPVAIHGLQAKQRGQHAGVELRWDPAAENDVVSYEVYRYPKALQAGQTLQTLGAPKHLASIPRDEATLTYFDLEGADQPGTYVVRAKDSFGHQSGVEFALPITPSETVAGTNHWDFNQTAEPFKAIALEGGVNDWQHGLILPVGNDESTFAFREMMIGLRHKIATKDAVWGTNLGRQSADLPEGIYDAQVSAGQRAALIVPALEIPAQAKDQDWVLDYQSFNALHYLKDYQENLEQVEVSTDQGKTWKVLMPASTIMDTADKFHFVWQQADLSAYAGQTLQLRFVLQTTQNQVINPYEIGWYVDNLWIGPRPVLHQAVAIAAAGPIWAHETEGDTAQPGSRLNLNTAEAAFLDQPLPEGAIPLSQATVEIEALGKFQPVNSATGAYSFSVSHGQWQLTAQAYGYQPQTVSIPDQKTDFYHDFVLEPLGQTTVSGVVKTADGKPLAQAYVRVLSDSNLTPVKTDDQGRYQLTGLFEGTHQLRAFAPQHAAQTVTITAKADQPAQQDFALQAQPGVDETLKFDNDHAKLNLIFHQPGKAAAVRFYPNKRNGQLVAAKAYFMNQPGVTDRRVKVAVMQDDENQRLVTRAEWTTEVTPDAWNTFDLRGDEIKTDRPFYILVFQINPNGAAYGVALDTQNLNSEETKHSYLYNGSFIPAASQHVVGAFMIRAVMNYPPDAPANSPDPAHPDAPSQPETPQLTEASDEDFEWETLEAGARVKNYKGSLKSLKIPDQHEGQPVLEIGAGAFGWKYLEALEIPETVQKIGEGAFSGAFKTSSEFSLKLPEATTELGANAFNGSGLKALYAPGVKEIGRQVFNRSNGLTIYAPHLKTLSPEAFGDKAVDGFKYNCLYVEDATGLEAIQGRVLINPARVLARVYLRESEKIDLEKTLYGPGDVAGYENYNDPADYYQIGQTVQIDPPKNITVSYYTGTQTITLSKPDQTVTFEADQLKAQVKPLYPGEAPLLSGYTLPGVRVRVIRQPAQTGPDGKVEAEVEWVADEYGLFEGTLKPVQPGDRLELELIDASGHRLTQTLDLMEKPENPFVMETKPVGRLLDYTGDQHDLDIPQTIQDPRGTERLVKILGPLALKNKQLTSLPGFENLELLNKLEPAALYGNQLETLQLPNNVKSVERAAVAHNQLKSLRLPRLLHRIGAYGFAHNQLEDLQLGEYTGHFGAYSFAHNQLRKLELPARVEELDQGAFMSNQLTEVHFAKLDPEVQSSGWNEALIGLSGEGFGPASGGGHSHVLTALAEEVFAENNLREVVLPDTISQVAPDAFARNGQIVNLLTAHPESVKDSILAEDSGHLVNGAEILVRLVDEAGKPLTADLNWVAQGLEKRIGAAESFYRLDQPARILAPEREGYKLVGTAEQTLTPKRGASNLVTFTYRRIAPATTEDGQPDPAPGDDKPDPGKPDSGNEPDPGKEPDPADPTPTPDENLNPEPPAPNPSQPGIVAPGDSQPVDSAEPTQPSTQTTKGLNRLAQNADASRQPAAGSPVPQTGETAQPLNQALALVSLACALALLRLACQRLRKPLN